MTLRWIIFGDDWGRHPSTTQHLARALAHDDEVVWLDSIGMRAPRASVDELRGLLRRLRARRDQPRSDPAPFPTFSPRVLPLHGLGAVRALNAVSLRWQLAAEPGHRTVVLASNPVAAWYLDAVPHDVTVYLRLDDYPRLPGVDARLAERAEQHMERRADVKVGTARALLRSDDWLLLPQGVDVAHFARRPFAPTGPAVLGFFGLFAEWVDQRLVADVARRHPEWTLEFLGPQRVAPNPGLRALPNVRFVDAVPFAQLPEATAHWRAAWVPFELSPLTVAVNPLKVREYLAAGLPAFSTPLPEVRGLPGVQVGATAEDVSGFLARAVRDTRDESDARRAAMKHASWTARARQLRAAALAAWPRSDLKQRAHAG